MGVGTAERGVLVMNVIERAQRVGQAAWLAGVRLDEITFATAPEALEAAIAWRRAEAAWRKEASNAAE